ncbi:MAG: peptidylprolyl isomerase [Oscillospiraceae bacterium]|jgi:hypothetical protein|nr:peptidylprolyl isomerase [Oscillospiraceae bacterium]
MKLRKILALILCIAMAAAFAASCDKTETIGNGDKTAAGNGTGIDFDAAYAAYKPDDVMITAGDSEVTWDLLYYFLAASVDEVINMSGSGTFPGWSDEEGLSYKEQVTTRALDGVLTYKTIEYGATLTGVSLTDDDLASIAFDRERAEEQYGGAEAFETELKAHRMSGEVYAYLSGISYLYDNAFAAVYGEGASKISDAEVAAANADADWLMAKHILFLTGTEDDDAVLAKAEEVLAQINSLDVSDFGAYFDDLIKEFGEDPGMVTNPNGYLFTAGDMVPEFEDATRALDFGGVSGLVQTSYGYHIIYRIPVDYDAVPSSWQQQGYTYSVRQDFASMQFQTDIEAWRQEMENDTVYSDLYNKLDITKIFK